MVSIPRIAAKISRTTLLGSVALCIGSYAYATESVQPASQQATVEQLQRQMQELMRQLEDIKQQQVVQQQHIEQQDQEIEQQKEQVASLPGAAAGTVAPANVVTGGDVPGSFKLPGTNTSIKIGGYVKGDLIYDVNADLGDTFAASAIPQDGSVQDNREGQFRAHARQTRINIATSTPTDFGVARTFIEGDFFGSGGNEVLSNSTSFRLRHAYGSLGPVLVGQTWSNFMFLDAYPDTVDFFGPVGIPFVRQGQIRYTVNPTENLQLSFSAENSELTAIADTTGDGLADSTLGSTRRSADDLQFGIDTLPDFTARVTYSDDWGALSLSGVGRYLEVDSGGAGNANDEEYGWGILVAGVLNLGEFAPAFGNDSIMANFTYGDGVGRYLINGFNQDAFLNANGNLDSIEAWGVAAAYTRHWTDNLRSNFVYGHYEIDDTFNPGATESLDTVHVNLMWTPTDRVQYGLEYIYGARDFQNSSFDNDANRVQFSAQFTF